MSQQQQYSSHQQQVQPANRQSHQRINPHQTPAHATKTSNSKKPQGGAGNTAEDSDIKEKLKAMLTQVHRGESAPRVTGTYPQGLKPSGSSPNAGPQGAGGQTRNNRNTHSLNHQRAGQKYNQMVPKRQDYIFGQNQRGRGLLGPQPEHLRGRKTLVLDLDETLVHSQFNQVRNPDYTIPVDIEGRIQHIYVMKRPGAEYFLQQMAQYFEVVIYTASLSKYADPLMNMMDPMGYCTDRLFREHCTFVNNVFVKDMGQIGRPMKDAVIIDNSPTSYMLQPECGLPIISWYDDPHDRALFDYIPVLIEMSKINDMREAVMGFVRQNTFTISTAMSVVAQIRDREQFENQKRLEQEKVRKEHLLQVQAEQIQKIEQQKQLQHQQQLQQQKQASQGNEQHQVQTGPSQEQKRTDPKHEDPQATPGATENTGKKPLINSWLSQQQEQSQAQAQAKQAQAAESQSNHLQQLQQRGRGQERPQVEGQRAQPSPSPQLRINTDPQLVAAGQVKSHRRHKSSFNANPSGGAQQNVQGQGKKPGASASLGPAAPGGDQSATASQQKVTNITNIIYNFNYGTPQAQAQNANGQSQSQGNTLVPNGPNGKDKAAQPNQLKGDPSLQIKLAADADQSLKTGGQTDDEDPANLAANHKKRPNTGSGTKQVFRQSFKRNQQAQNPGSAAQLKPKDPMAQAAMQQQVAGLARYAGQSENQIGKVVKMSRKSTIDQKDANASKMVVVLDKNRGGSQKKSEFAQSFTPTNNSGFAQSSVNPTTQIQNKMLQVSLNGQKSLKSKLKQNSSNPFYAGPSPKVLPIEIGGQRQQIFNQIKTPQSALMGNMSIQKNFKPESRAIKAFTPSAAGSEMRYQTNGEQPSQSIFNFNQSPTAASQNSQSVMLTTPQNGNFKLSHQAIKSHFSAATSPANASGQASGERHVMTGGQKRQQPSSKVRSFSQNQGSRKNGLNNILVYNQSAIGPQGPNHSRNQSSVLKTQQQQSGQPNGLQLQAHGFNSTSGQIQIGTRSVQNANGQSQILYSDSPQMDGMGAGGLNQSSLGTHARQGDKQAHSALVEKYSNFLKKSKGGTPSGAELAMHPNGRPQRVSQSNASQIINKLRNSQNQALNASAGMPVNVTHKSGSQNSNYPRNLLVIPQNAVNQAPQGPGGPANGMQTFIAMSPKTSSQIQPNARGSSREKFSTQRGGSQNFQGARNQRVIMINNSSDSKDPHQKGGIEKPPSPKIQAVSPSQHQQQINFQMQVNSAPGKKPSPKHQNGGPTASSYLTKQNPFKGQVAVADHSVGMQQHAQFVNQPHHLMMPGQGAPQPSLSNIMAVSAAAEKDDVLNLQNLYPQSQSPMSFKQMQKAKRQKRNNGSLMGSIAVQGPYTRQSNNGSMVTGAGASANQSPLHQFYAATKNQPARQ